MSPLEKKIKTLSPELQQEVEQFVDRLLVHKQRKAARPLKQDWAGVLKAHKHQFSALELQKKALVWRSS